MRVPDLTGYRLDDACELLRGSGIAVERVERTRDPRGGQEPALWRVVRQVALPPQAVELTVAPQWPPVEGDCQPWAL